MEHVILLLPILLPLIAGIVLFFFPIFQNRKILHLFIGVILIIHTILSFGIVGRPEGSLIVWNLTDTIPILLKMDGLSKIFLSILAMIWLCAGFYSLEYMRQERERETSFFGFFLLTLAALNGVGLSGNLVTLYLFYEMMTLVSMPLVLHSRSKEAIRAAKKYLFYSVAGACMALVGIFFVYYYGTTLEFIPGGVLDSTKLAGKEGVFLIAVFITILGFGVKAGMVPLQSWLPTAHPIAPAPASAILSGNITKAGVLALIRFVYFIVGPDFLKGTWVQYTWMGLALLTVFMGSMLAYKEPVLKKRLAFSTVSQVSYILFGLALLNTVGLVGALLHLVFHSLIKNTLFLTAGSIIEKTGKKKVEELRGIGKEMPVVLWCFTLVSVALIGIPPTSGFVSKWFLGIGSLESKIPVFSWLGPVILLISALLTAGYLLPITIRGFFPGKDFDYKKLEKKEPSLFMTVPLLFLTGAAIVFGIMPGYLIKFIQGITSTLL